MSLRIKPVLLAEGFRSTPIESKLGLPLSLLPIRPGQRLIELWQEKITACFGDCDVTDIVVSSSEGFQSFEPLASVPGFRRTIDPKSHRGTGGVLRDLVDREKDAFSGLDYILVIDRDSCPPHSLDAVRDTLAASVDVVVAVSDLDRLAGLIAIRPEVFESISDRGYVDLKEQALNEVLSSGLHGRAATVMQRAIRVRNLATWFEAIRFHCSQTNTSNNTAAVVRGHCLISESARIGTASIIDSVVMENAVIGNGAVIARSVIPPAAEVPPGVRVVDSVFYEGGRKAAKR